MLLIEINLYLSAYLTKDSGAVSEFLIHLELSMIARYLCLSGFQWGTSKDDSSRDCGDRVCGNH